MIPRKALHGAFAFVAALFLSAAAHAQLFRAYLDPSGSDANPCTLAQPCRLLPAALTAVASGGEIWMLDSGNYNTGPVAVTKSVTILAVPGALGSVVALGGDAIVVATPGVKVALRNLVIVPFPGSGGTNGVNMTNGAVLTVENCLIANLPGSGISVNGSAIVRVTDTTIRDNGANGLLLGNGARGTVTRTTVSGNAQSGVLVGGNAANTTTADIADSTIDGNDYGVFAFSGAAATVVKVSVRDSRAVNSVTTGLIAQSALGGAATLSASNNIVSNNGSTGIMAMSAGSKVWATGNTVSDNGTGLFNSSGSFESACNNAVRNNASNVAGAITSLGCPPTSLVINEVDYDQVSTDTNEFIEIYNPTPTTKSLAGLALVLINGATNAEYLRVDLSAAGSIPSGGYLVIASNTVVVALGAAVIRFGPASDNVQNGAPDGVVLFDTVSNLIVDSLSYEGSITAATIAGAPGTYNLVRGTATTFADSNTVPASLVRLPNGINTANDIVDWSLSSNPTPGAANVP